MSGATLAILAGGQGARMGRPKGSLRVGGRPILEYLLRRFEWAGPRVLVTSPGRERPVGWEGFTKEVVDPVAGVGPLRGVLTALEAVQTPVLVVATVDMPGVTRGQLEFLCSELEARPEALGVLLRRKGSAGPMVEPFPSIFRREAREVVAEAMRGERRSVVGLANDARVQVVTAPLRWPEGVWTNLNYPQDLERFAASPIPDPGA